MTKWLGELRRRSEGRFWEQVRWQLLLHYILAGAVPCALILVLAVAAGNLLVRQGTVLTVEHQMDAVGQSMAGITSAAVDALATMQQSAEEVQDLGSVISESFPHSRLRLRETTDKGAVQEFSNAPGPWPESFPEDRFTGVVIDHNRLWICGWVRKIDHGDRAEALLMAPLDEVLAQQFSSETGVRIQAVGPSPLQSDIYRPGLLRLVEANFFPRSADWLPVSTPARNPRTGAWENYIAFEVWPSWPATVHQLRAVAALGASWTHGLVLLILVIALAEGGAALLLHRLSGRLLRQVEDLTQGASQFATGNLSHRIPLLHRDELGRTAAAFNDMAGSLLELQRQEHLRRQLEQDLQLARTVQEALYPAQVPSLPEASLAVLSRPARIVSGDLYDFIDLGGGRLGLLCADVSGKGFAAALGMARLQATLRVASHDARLCGSGERVVGPSELIAKVNQEMCRRTNGSQYATLFWAEYDNHSRRLEYVNAGHPPPLLFVPGRPGSRLLEQGGMPVGLFSKAEFATGRVTLPDGAVLLMYTDGLTEANSPAGEEFGAERVMSLCQSWPNGNLVGLPELLLQSLSRWVGGKDLEDDVTLILFGTNGTRLEPSPTST